MSTRPATARLTRRARAITPSPTLALAQAAGALRRSGVDIIDLGLGEPDFPTPDFIARAGISAIERGQTKYTDSAGTAELREAVAEKFRRRGAQSVDARRVVISAGGKQTLFNACQVLFEEGDDVAVFRPYWVSFPEMVRLAGARPVWIPTDRAEAWRPRLRELASRATPGLRGVILNTPSNPTGAAIEAEELARILEWTRERGIFVLFDECYEHFLYDGRTHASPAEVWSEHEDHTVISGAASKTYSMTGWRVGWAVGPRAVIAAMASLQSHSTSNACSVSQAAALAALTQPDAARAAVASMLSEYARRRDAIAGGLNAVDGVECPLPDGAFYAFADVSALYPRAGVTGSSDLAEMLLQSAGVAAVPGAAFGEDSCLRFSFAAPLPTIQEGLRRFQEFVRKL
jgi:aspartate aminotransferase